MLVKIIIGSYGLLMTLGVCIQSKERLISFSSAFLMVMGSLMVIGSCLLDQGSQVLTLILGLSLIHVSAWMNGKKIHGRITLSHHLGRLTLSLVLLSLCGLDQGFFFN